MFPATKNILSNHANCSCAEEGFSQESVDLGGKLEKLEPLANKQEEGINSHE